MLKGIPRVISSEMMKVLMEMGHGDEIVIADGNFPSATCAKRLIKADGHGVPEILDAILKFFPLDNYVEYPVALMGLVSSDIPKPEIWKEFDSIARKNDSSFKEFEFVERFEFYERAKRAFAVISTSETAIYANIIIKKGVVA